MANSYQEIINELIDRLYIRTDQETKRKILKSYFTQDPKKRKLTLDDLGRIGGVTRERARQILGDFNNDLPKEIAKLNRYPKESLLGINEDLRNLRENIMKIVSEISVFERPVFAKNVQDGLQSKGVLDQHIYIPAAFDLAEIFSIPTDFKIADYNDHKIIVNLNDAQGKYTEGVISYAAKIATHCSGVFSVDRLVNSGWDPEAPKSIENIPAEIRRTFILDLLSTKQTLILLQGSDFYAFRERDERISSVLTPIFYAYKTPIEKTVLINAVQRAIKLRLKQKKDSRKNIFIDVLENSGSAIDEYCRRTLLLDVENTHYRVPGAKLVTEIKNYKLGSIYKNQFRILEKIRENGSPVDSSLFGKLSENMPGAQNNHLYSYPVLYYKEGEGRRHDLYKTLDGIYSVLSNMQSDKIDDWEKRVNLIREKIQKLQNELNNLDVSTDEKLTYRAEQSLLRELLIALSPKAKTAPDLLASRCQICNKYYPVQLLVASHVKPRAKCGIEERKDFENIAMLQCKSCDALYENGYVSVDDDGIVIATDSLPMTDDLKELVSQIAGNSCDYVNGNVQRLAYLKYHRENLFNN